MAKKTGHKGDRLPIFPDLMVLVPADGEIYIEKMPPWLASWAGISSDEAEGRPVSEILDKLSRVFSTLSRDILKDGMNVEDYEVELTDLNGIPRVISIQAHRIAGYRSSGKIPSVDGGYALLMRIRDISSQAARSRFEEEPVTFHGIVGASAEIRNVFHKIEVYGPADAPVIITGETGTGKELVARALHETSSRRSGPFVAVNCSALNEDLFESELFGHERGSFTGAVRAHRGRFERANTGTLFLDEIGDMPGRSQVKLLRVLETGAIERVGGEREISLDVRLLAATNIPLERAVSTQRFRADLYHRISVFRIHIPPLRERTEDIIHLINHFLQILNRRYGRGITRVTNEALRLLEQYYWPGNVRELRNVLERVYVETQGTVIGRNAFNEWIRERDYLSAGDWNIERLEDQRALHRVIVPLDKSGDYKIVHSLPADPEGPGPVGVNGADTLTVINSGKPYAIIQPASQGWVRDGSVVDAEYRVAKPSPKRKEKITVESLGKAFRKADGNITRASELLGIHKATFYRHMKLLGLDRESLSGPVVDDTDGDTSS